MRALDLALIIAGARTPTADMLQPLWLHSDAMESGFIAPWQPVPAWELVISDAGVQHFETCSQPDACNGEHGDSANTD
jgi:hypothetical protein